MSDPKTYADLVRRLAVHGYEVLPDRPGYLVRHDSNPTNVSRARHLNDLIDFTELIEWAARRQQDTPT